MRIYYLLNLKNSCYYFSNDTSLCVRLGEYLNLYFQNYMSEKDAQEQKLHGKMNYNIEGKHVNSVLSQEEEEEGRRRTALRGLKGDRGLRVRSVSFGTSMRRSSRSAFGRPTGNDVSGH